ncbi:MAG: hypothetical protein ACK4TA_05520 [Saprospiraceae bacterium]
MIDGAPKAPSSASCKTLCAIFENNNQYMEITNEVKTRNIKFIKVESVRDHYPSHRIQIEIGTENIQTNFDNYIWLSDTNIENFLTELDKLDKYRKGQAILESMSPEEMQLVFKAIDDLGHLSVALQLAKENRINQDYSYTIKVEFEIDPTSLANIKREMLELMK